MSVSVVHEQTARNLTKEVRGSRSRVVTAFRENLRSGFNLVLHTGELVEESW